MKMYKLVKVFTGTPPATGVAAVDVNSTGFRDGPDVGSKEVVPGPKPCSIINELLVPDINLVANLEPVIVGSHERNVIPLVHISNNAFVVDKPLECAIGGRNTAAYNLLIDAECCKDDQPTTFNQQPPVLCSNSGAVKTFYDGNYFITDAVNFDSAYYKIILSAFGPWLSQITFCDPGTTLARPAALQSSRTDGVAPTISLNSISDNSATRHRQGSGPPVESSVPASSDVARNSVARCGEKESLTPVLGEFILPTFSKLDATAVVSSALGCLFDKLLCHSPGELDLKKSLYPLAGRGTDIPEFNVDLTDSVFAKQPAFGQQSAKVTFSSCCHSSENGLTLCRSAGDVSVGNTAVFVNDDRGVCTSFKVYDRGSQVILRRHPTSANRRRRASRARSDVREKFVVSPGIFPGSYSKALKLSHADGTGRILPGAKLLVDDQAFAAEAA